MDFSSAMREFGMALRRKSPEILTGIGIAGFFTSTVLAVQATPKAMEKIKEKKAKTRKEKVKAAWKCYIPTGITMVASSACLIGSTSIQGRRNAALATAYSLSESALKAYTEKVIETIGEKKEKQIRSAIAQDAVNERGVVPQEQIIFTGNTRRSTTEFYDEFSHQTFYSSIDRLEKVRNDLNARRLREHFISVNEFYDELNLKHIPKVGDEIGWHVERDEIELDFHAVLQDDRPVIVMEFKTRPEYFDMR